MSENAEALLFKNVPNMSDRWRQELAHRLDEDYLTELFQFVDRAYMREDVSPSNRAELFRAFELTDLDKTKIVILGHDPYPKSKNEKPERACGLAFSYSSNALKPTFSLKNILAELNNDVDIETTCSDLSPWAERGVLLLNAALTYQGRAKQAKSRKIWRPFVKASLSILASSGMPVVFLVWGRPAQKLVKEIDLGQACCVLSSTHPSNCSKNQSCSSLEPFVGSKPFSKANDWLEANGVKGIDWSLEQRNI